MRLQNVVCRPVFALLVAATLLAAIVGSVRPANGQKPVPPPPSPPPVNYRITWLDSLGKMVPRVEDVNNWGVVVGEVHNTGGVGVDSLAFVYAGALNGAVIDLDSYVVTMIGEIGETVNRADWTLIVAYDINDVNQIVGWAQNKATLETRGFVTNYPSTECTLLPRPTIPGFQRAARINNSGEIVAAEGNASVVLYRWDTNTNKYVRGLTLQPPTTLIDSRRGVIITGFNDVGQILVSPGVRYTPVVGWQDFGATYGIYLSNGMNQSGSIVGNRNVGRKSYAFRYTDATGMLDFPPGSSSARDINLDGDVCINPGKVYSEKLKLLLTLNDLVVGTPTDLADWKNASDKNNIAPEAMTDRIAPTDFGAISGRATFVTKNSSYYKTFLLWPEAVN